MDVTAVCQRVRAVASVRSAPDAGRVELEGGLRSVAVVRSWLAAAEADLAVRLAGFASFPEQAIAQAGRGSQDEAGRVLERSGTLGKVPSLAGALNDGSVTPGHVDAVTKVAKGLEGDQRDALLERADKLVAIARHGTVADFRKRLESEAKSLRADDGMARFERQKRAARLRRWTDGDGMWCLQGRFDPLTGVRLDARLTAEIEAAFAESVPEGCPTDPLEKSQFLAACALARIMEDGGVAQRAGRPEFVVVIEADAKGESPATVEPNQGGAPASGRPNQGGAPATGRTHGDTATDGSPSDSPPSDGPPSDGPPSDGPPPGDPPPGDPASDGPASDGLPPGDPASDGPASGPPPSGPPSDGPASDGPASDGPPPGGWPPGGGRPRVDWGLPVEVPYSVLIDLFADADVYPVIVRNGVVLYAPGELNLGRTTRLANRAQRRALRAMYATCAIPGCETRFERCKIHHVHWWRHGGRTDLENLLPMCVHHHTKVHNHGWVVTLGQGRTLTLRLPDGTIHNTGPPGRRAA